MLSFDQHLSEGKLQDVFTPMIEPDSFCLHFESTLPVCVKPFCTLRGDRYLSRVGIHITALSARRQQATVPLCCSPANLKCILTHACLKLP